MARRTTRVIVLPLLALAALAGGCRSWDLLPRIVTTPRSAVEGVEVTDVTPDGASALVRVRLTNPNDVPLPLTLVRYSIEIGGRRYEGETNPNATIPAERDVVVPLTGAVAGAVGDAWRVDGAFSYQPPGEIRDLMTDLGLPLPWVSFNGRGMLGAAPVAAEPVADVEPALGEKTEAPRDGATGATAVEVEGGD